MMRFFRRRPHEHSASKTWEASQRYELEHAIVYMDSPQFRSHHADLVSGKLNVSSGYRDQLMLREFFGDSSADFEHFLSHVKARVSLDIGPCVASQIAGWDVAAVRYAIEPLLDPIVEWQKSKLNGSAYEGMVGFARPAEELIGDLVGKVDGAIVCRNMLDHSPHWPFVLSNISSYAAQGCKLLLWTDIDHRGTADEGHYDITSDARAFRRLVEQLGFRVIREYSAAAREELNWGCFAERL